MTRSVAFPEFFARWALQREWAVPDIHWLACDWLCDWSKGRVKVLRMFRGASKSTTVGVLDSWMLRETPGYRILVQSSDDQTARKMSRDTKSILKRHPYCSGMLPARDPSGDRFWVNSNEDARNPSMTAQGIMSNITSSRADLVIFDDVEVPRNIRTPEARADLRARISDSTHVLTPQGRKLYIGTPHTHDSLYDELERDGADCLTIPLFSKNHRIEQAHNLGMADVPWDAPADGLYVFNNRLLMDPSEYEWRGQRLRFKEPVSGVIDVNAGNAWPERFDRAEIQFKRSECRTQNEWDSQYLLIARPLHDIRLDPGRIKLYSDEVEFRSANGELTAWLRGQPLAGVRTYWDVSLGKIRGDVSAFSIVFGDEKGNLYWHRTSGLGGDLDAQCQQIKTFVTSFRLPRVSVETNGIGAFVPAMLKKHLAGTGCGVKEKVATKNKQTLILEAIEPPMSAGMLYAHNSVAETGAFGEMRDWVPEPNIQDDYINSLAGAILESPVRLRRPDVPMGQAPWLSHGKTFDVKFTQ